MKIHLGPFCWDVQLHQTPEVPNTDGFFGLCDNNNQIIHVITLCKRQRILITFLHEIFHAIYYSGGMQGQEGKKQEIDEESIVGLFASGMAEVIRRNPKIWPFIIELAKNPEKMGLP